MKKLIWLSSIIITIILICCQENTKVEIPTIDGDWWQVAGDPDLGDYITPGQQPVDFGVWQAADRTPALFTSPYWNTLDAMTLKHDDQFMIGEMAIAAPEIIVDQDGQYYIAAYRPKGIFMAKLTFIETTTPCKYD